MTQSSPSSSARVATFLASDEATLRFGHGIGRADLAVQQRLQPLLLLLGRADLLQHFHVAGVGRRAVERLRRQRLLAELGGDVGIVEVGEAAADLGMGQEEIPQAGSLGLVLGALEQLELAGRPAPVVLAAFAQAEELVRDRRDVLLDVLHHRVEQRLRLLRHGEVVEIGVEIGPHRRGRVLVLTFIGVSSSLLEETLERIRGRGNRTASPSSYDEEVSAKRTEGS